MAAYIMHRFTGEDTVLRMASGDEWRCFIENHNVAYIWGTQGPDTLFHDTPFLSLSAKNGDLGEYGGYMHRRSTAELFERVSRFLIEKKDSPEYPALVAFACGFISHYCVDKQIHAYVYSFSKQLRGVIKTQNPSGAHAKLETDMDTAFYFQREGKDIRRFALEPEMRSDRQDIAAIELFFIYLVEQVYGRRFAEGKIVQAVQYFYDKEKFLFDKTGIKSYLYCRFKEILYGEKVSYTLYYRPKTISYDVLNLAHVPWVNPLKPDRITKMSVPELLDLAADETVSFIEEMRQCVYEGKPLIRGQMDSFDCGSDGSIIE